MARINFLNTQIDNVTMDEAIETIDILIQSNKYIMPLINA